MLSYCFENCKTNHVPKDELSLVINLDCIICLQNLTINLYDFRLLDYEKMTCHK